MIMLRKEECGYRSKDWPDNHRCARNKGHMSRHVRWCGYFHGQGADYTGRWEDYMKPEIKGEKNQPA